MKNLFRWLVNDPLVAQIINRIISVDNDRIRPVLPMHRQISVHGRQIRSPNDLRHVLNTIHVDDTEATVRNLDHEIIVHEVIPLRCDNDR